MRIVALVPGGISQQLLFFPTLETLQTQYPQGAIDVVVEPRAKPAYRVCPHVHEVLAFDYLDRNGLADYLNLLGTIRDREYDAAILAEPRWDLELLLWLNGIPRRVGYQGQASWFLSHPVPRKPEQYAPNLYHDLLPGLGIHSPCPPLKVVVPKEDIDWAEAEQKRLDLKENGYVLVHGGRAGTYPVQKWQEIIGDIQEKQPSLAIVLLQTPEAATWVGEMQRACPGIKAISPPDLGKLAAAIAGANLMVSTAGVSLHLAVAVGTYTVAFLARGEGIKLLPPSGGDRYLAVESPTGNLADIDPAAVLQQIWRS